MKRFMKPETLYYTALLLMGLFVAGTFISPFMVNSGNGLIVGAGAVFYKIASYFCAQVPERSLHFGTTQLPLDARMTGAFVAGFLALLAPSLWRPRRVSWVYLVTGVLLVLPLVVDGSTQTIFVLRESNNYLRLATGALAGSGMLYALGAVLMEDVERLSPRLVTTSPPFKAAVAICLVVAIFVNGLGLLFGGFIMTRGEALARAAKLSGSANTRLAYWLPPNAGISAAIDPFSARYNDAVLNDLVEVIGLRSVVGAWVVASVDKPSKVTKAPFLTETPGKIIYIDAAKNVVILSTVHR